MAKSNGSMTWQEDKTTVAEYCDTHAEAIGEFNVMEFNDYLSQGDKLISRQNSITKLMKAKCASLERILSIPSPFISNQGKRPAMVLTEDEEATRPYNLSTNDENQTVLVLDENAHTLFGKFYRMKNDDGSSIESTGYGTNENMLVRVILAEVEKTWLAGIKEARSE
tara:strand:+ start:264 stop:764 length:501 start_codon:yes stop_codon:yes gene_type:complete